MRLGILLVVILGLNILSFQNQALWLFAWALPVTLLMLLQAYNKWPVWLLTWVLMSVGTIVGMRAMVPLPTPIAEIFLVLMSVSTLLPYWLHTKYSARITGFCVTLVLPIAATSLEFFSAAISPWGTWGALANTQIDNPVLAQLSSLTGLSGITFLIYWVAAVVFYVWSHRQVRASWLPAAVSLVVTLVLVTGYGMYRLSYTPPSTNIRVGIISVSGLPVMQQMVSDLNGTHVELREDMNQTDPNLSVVNSAMVAFITDPQAMRFAKTREALKTNVHDAFSLAAKAIAQGAEVISWHEGQFMVFDGDASRLIMEAQGFAYEHKVMLVIPLAIITPGKITPHKRFMKNQVLLIGPQGNVLYTYNKSKPVPEVEPVVPGDGVVPVVNIKDSKLATVICYDADFPRLVRQAGVNNADILFIPSGDWYDIRYAHMNMARFRAIENGVNVVRPASRGISAVIDARGRVLASQNYFDVTEHLLIADVPRNGTSSLYAHIGDSFAWLSVLGALLLLGNYMRVMRRP